jgi:hypothetical protein
MTDTALAFFVSLLLSLLGDIDMRENGVEVDLGELAST